jgi:hypothetical protein
MRDGLVTGAGVWDLAAMAMGSRGADPRAKGFAWPHDSPVSAQRPGETDEFQLPLAFDDDTGQGFAPPIPAACAKILGLTPKPTGNKPPVVWRALIGERRN